MVRGKFIVKTYNARSLRPGVFCCAKTYSFLSTFFAADGQPMPSRFVFATRNLPGETQNKLSSRPGKAVGYC